MTIGITRSQQGDMVVDAVTTSRQGLLGQNAV